VLNSFLKKLLYEPQLTDYLHPEDYEQVSLLDTVETASCENIYRWDRLSCYASYWYWNVDHLSNRLVNFYELKNVFRSEDQESLTICLDQITMLSASKGDLRNAKDLEDFSLREEPKRIPSWLDDISDEQLQRMMSHREIRISNNVATIKQSTSDRLATFSWQKGYALLNNGGSHHLAAAKFIAKRLSKEKEVRLTGSHTHYFLSLFNIRSLNNEYDLYLVPKNNTIYSSLIEYARATKASFGFISTESVANIQGEIVFVLKQSVIGDELSAVGYQHIGHYLEHIYQLNNKK